MESSIAVFLKRWQACELPPTGVVAGQHTKHSLSPPRAPPSVWWPPAPARNRYPPTHHTQSARKAVAAGRRHTKASAAHPCGRGNSAISDA